MSKRECEQREQDAPVEKKPKIESQHDSQMDVAQPQEIAGPSGEFGINPVVYPGSYNPGTLLNSELCEAYPDIAFGAPYPWPGTFQAYSDPNEHFGIYSTNFEASTMYPRMHHPRADNRSFLLPPLPDLQFTAGTNVEQTGKPVGTTDLGEAMDVDDDPSVKEAESSSSAEHEKKRTA